MKKIIIMLLTLAFALSFAACGGEKEKGTDTSGAGTSTQTETTAPENTTAQGKDTLAAKGMTCTVTVPNPATFINGYEIVDAGCNASTAVENIYVKLYKEDPKTEINVHMEQLTVSSAKTQDAKGYAEYCNSKKLGPYDPVKIAGYSGYLRSKFSDSTKVADNWYILDYPLSDGGSMVLNLYVGQKYADDTSAVTPIAEAFLKNIEVAPNNG